MRVRRSFPLLGRLPARARRRSSRGAANGGTRSFATCSACGGSSWWPRCRPPPPRHAAAWARDARRGDVASSSAESSSPHRTWRRSAEARRRSLSCRPKPSPPARIDVTIEAAAASKSEPDPGWVAERRFNSAGHTADVTACPPVRSPRPRRLVRAWPGRNAMQLIVPREPALDGTVTWTPDWPAGPRSARVTVSPRRRTCRRPRPNGASVGRCRRRWTRRLRDHAAA